MTVDNIPMQGESPTLSDATEGQAPSGDISGDMFGDAIDRIAGGVEQKQVEQPAIKPEHHEQHQEPADKPIEAPQHWPADQREAFADLSPAERKVVLERNKQLESLYGRKAQELAEQQKQLAGWEALQKRVMTDPQFAQHVFGYDQVQQQKQAPQPPEDPIDRLKWEAKQEALKEFAPELDRVRQEMAQHQHATAIRATMERVQADPMYQQVQGEILQYISGLPEGVGRAVYQELDRSPQLYMEMYSRTRQRLTGSGAQPNQQPQQRGPDGRFAAPEMPKPKQRQERAPMLESSGTANDTTANAQQRKKELQARVKQGQATSSELGEWFQSLGIIDRITR